MLEIYLSAKEEPEGINYAGRKLLVGRIAVGRNPHLLDHYRRVPWLSCQPLSEILDSETSSGQCSQVYLVPR